MKHDFRRFYRWFIKFLHKHVGENVDDVFAIFCKIQPDGYIKGEFNPREEFQNVFKSDAREYVDPGMFYGYGKFYLDEKKFIRFIPWDKLHTKNHPDLVLSESPEPIYHIDLVIFEKLVKYQEIKEIFIKSLGNVDFLDLCDNKSGIIEPRIYRKLQKAEDKIKYFIYINRNKDNKFHKLYYCSNNKFTYTTHEKKILKYGDPEYRRKMWEKQDREKKTWREHLKQKEEYNSKLLGRVESERKRKETEENDIKIKKHGFSKTESFRGEEYHGQKRKKKKK